ncbi:MAG: phosphate/phosphite/phosphonate ABC transporter substrate-binding protein [Desulfovibrionaceae bacterium]|jgi:phosphonate transport system substrate-binding protein|nr:phosphate/phosphite/phosphonate ABC transporter substrate-binding protein [Desulfovibrionaceae bacterium]
MLRELPATARALTRAAKRGCTSPAGLAFALVAALAFALASCSDEEPAKRVDLTKRVEITAPGAPEGVTYAYLPQYSHAISYKRHRGLVDYLTRATGIPVRQVFPATFDEHVNMVARGEIDISFSNPFIYTRLAKLGSRVFARIVEPTGEPYFRGQIICRRDNRAIRTLADCRGKHWIAVDPFSAGGFLFALGLFHDNGIARSDFAEVAFAPGPGGSQEKVVMAVYAGTYDVGSVREGTLDLLKGRIELDRIRVLARTRAYPGWLYSARRGLDQDKVQKIAKAMFKLSMKDPEAAAILSTAGMRAIIPARDEEYAPILDLVRRLGLEDGRP